MHYILARREYVSSLIDAEAGVISYFLKKT
jgi:hypothetical protein